MTSKPPSQMDWAAMLARFDADADVGVSDKELDGVVAGDVDVATLQDRLDADEASAARLQVLQDEQKQLASVVDNVLQRAQAQLLQEQEAEQKAAVTKERPGLLASVSSSWLSSWKRLFAVGAPLAAAAAILLVPMLREPTSSTTTDSLLEDNSTIKGSGLTFIVNGNDGKQRKGRSGDIVEPGERLQFYRTSGKDNHFMMILVDDAGRAESIAPFGGQQSLFVKEGTGVPVSSGSLRLDDELGVERVVALFSTKPFTLVDVQQALDRQLPVAGGSAMAQALTEERLRHLKWPGYPVVVTLNKVASKKSTTPPGGTP